MPIGIAYFTTKTKDERLVHEAKLRQLTDHGDIALHPTCRREGEKWQDAMPVAIKLVADCFEKVKERAEIQEMHDNPPDMSPGQAYFINQMRAKKERKAAEIQAIKENPLSPLVTGQYFGKKNEQKQ